ncbi:hypothetical protein ACFU96_21195 [Streptomyces sp. NPDC057620]|uniref:hypothetical protein n=1 Tax=Streptomyces sp. NPDC057620 TaxID=3346185 RepID=UPI003684A4AD
MNSTNNTGAQGRPSNAQIAPLPAGIQGPEMRPAESAAAKKPRPSLTIEAPSVETTAISVTALGVAADLAGLADGPVSGPVSGVAMTVGVVTFLVKKCIKRNR